jgi:hypothetical protein
MNTIPKRILVYAFMCCMFVLLCDFSYVSCTGIRTPENSGFGREGMHVLKTSPAEYRLCLLLNWINISQKRLQKFCLTVLIIILILNPKAFYLTDPLLIPYNCSSTPNSSEKNTEFLCCQYKYKSEFHIRVREEKFSLCFAN